MDPMDPIDEFQQFQQFALARMRYIQILMAYIVLEWDNVPETVLPQHVLFFNQCCDGEVSIPNAAGFFAEKFLQRAEA